MRQSASHSRQLHEHDAGPARRRRRPPELHAEPGAEVLLILDEADDVAVATAALHLVGLQVRTAESFHVVFATNFVRPPILVVYAQSTVARSPVERELLAAFRRRAIPLLCVSDRRGAYVADPWLQRPFAPVDLLRAAADVQPALYEHGAAALVEAGLEGKLRVLARQQPVVEAALALLDILKLRDIETALHCYRVQAYARRLAQLVAPDCLADGTAELGFLLHDIGKLALPDSILQKHGPLTHAERQLMQTHPVIGAEMAAHFLDEGPGLNVVRSHHERWDGGGYPDGLAGPAIPVEARVFAVADALDALTSDRPYRRAEPWPAAIRALRAEAGTHFDPRIAAVLENEAPTLLAVREQLTATPGMGSPLQTL